MIDVCYIETCKFIAHTLVRLKSIVLSYFYTTISLFFSIFCLKEPIMITDCEQIIELQKSEMSVLIILATFTTLKCSLTCQQDIFSTYLYVGVLMLCV